MGKSEGLEIVVESGGKTGISVFAKKGGAICEASFYSLPEDWSANEPLFRESLKSMRIR